MSRPSRTSPYQGLTPFDEADAAYFFGRDKDTRLITADLFASALTLLYGASGVGKSSVLRAGVVPLLRQRDDVVPVLFSAWSSDPLLGVKDAVAAALSAISPEGTPKYRELRDASAGHKGEPLDRYLALCAAAAGRRLLIILDQFEEYSLYHPTDEGFAE